MRLGYIFDRILDGCAWIGCGLIMFQVVSVSLEVVVRYLFDTSFGWVIAMNEWSLILMAFLGAAWLQREGGHTSDDSVVLFFPPWVKVAATWVGWVIAIVTCALLVWYGTTATIEKYTSGAFDFFKMRNVPIWIIYAVIPFGSLLWLIQLLRPSGRDSEAEAAGLPETTDI